MVVYCIRDTINGYLAPFGEVNDDVAIRGFHSLVNSEGSLMNRYPTYFSLYKLCEFNQDSGIIAFFQNDLLGQSDPIIVAKGADMIGRDLDV